MVSRLGFAFSRQHGRTVLSPVAGSLKSPLLHQQKDFVSPINHDRVRPSSTKDDLVVRVQFVPLYFMG
jgi:hypothetical protein